MTLAPPQPLMAKLMSQQSNEELVRRARAGSSACFEELVARFQGPLLHFLLRRTAGRDDADDLLQETFLRAYVSLPSYRETWPIQTWLFTIAHRLCINHARKLAVRKSEKLSYDPLGQDDPPTLALVKAEEAGSLWKIARSLLSEDQFTAIWLYYVEEMPPGEITKVLDRSWIAVKTMLHRARRRLLPHLQKLDVTGQPEGK
jgi:RNA polymerase sigma-70 factor (ECF subfamily)